MLLTPKKFGGMQNTSRYLVSIGHITGHDTNLVCRMSHCHHQNPRDPNPSGTNRDLVTADPGIKWLGRAFIICMYITYAHCSRLWGHIGIYIYIYIQVYIHIIYNTYIVYIYIYLTHVYIYITYIGMYIYAYIYIYICLHILYDPDITTSKSMMPKRTCTYSIFRSWRTIHTLPPSSNP